MLETKVKVEIGVSGEVQVFYLPAGDGWVLLERFRSAMVSYLWGVLRVSFTAYIYVELVPQSR